MSGCGPKSPAGTLSNLAAEFKSADPALKAKAEQAAASAKTNDYLGAVLALRELKATPALAPKQRKAVETALDAVMNQMFDEAAKENPQAVQARDALRQMQRPR
jgi:hypothetical protein